MFGDNLFGKTHKEVTNIMEKRKATIKECLSSWSDDEIYNCFREVTDNIHSMENREAFTQVGWKQLQRMEHELVKIFATKKTDADLPV
jgi:hypothetical protein|tara:strand:+ start:35 stop:298 length:264 start_codon:yes stop_codon:yes gene_type:complete